MNPGYTKKTAPAFEGESAFFLTNPSMMHTPNRKQPTERIERMRPLLFWLGVSLSIGLSIALIEIQSPERLVHFRSLKTVLDDSPIAEVIRREVPEKKTARPLRPADPAPSPEPDPFNPISDTATGPETEPNTDTSGIKTVDIGQEDGADDIKDVFNVARRVTFVQCASLSDDDQRFECFQIELQKHIVKNLVYPAHARDLNEQGKVYVEFVVDKQGHIESAEVVRGVSPLLDAAALATIKTLPVLEPARNQALQPVRMRFVMPVVYTLRN
ncbi:TonB family protein [bacterium]|nr:TonB family protein [bacterium]